MLGELLKLLLLKEKEQMVLDVEEAATARPSPPFPSPRAAMRSSWDETGMGRGQQSSGGCHGWLTALPLPPGLSGLSRLSTASFNLPLDFVFLLCPFHESVPADTTPSHGCALLCSGGVTQHLQDTVDNPFSSPQWVY